MIVKHNLPNTLRMRTFSNFVACGVYHKLARTDSTTSHLKDEKTDLFNNKSDAICQAAAAAEHNR
ncbi:hypothetical protein KDI_12370 [Dictyobacter arantiisoli]|uniref:Uncharacterized protein n=1 Tax=Dictyobacter arantiisoli TaxID=2014874 RepID=A0A5A5T9G7_9CHLR|nr:hypothetical protein KDI_12370 [Dictyobacter arantiisoli]